ncbi:catalase [Clostridium aestuarii]|uniref:Catalase n=1 Tax=Clostridium aestuarii TaxID=338193 RepID=A0ABT4CY13_9CLOT|nr:catalase [Clostridium aestuarii]MCY6483864.1 catalase [Clostridium aestuarii]
MKNIDESSNDYLTTDLGVPVSNNQNSLTVGERGPVLLQDIHLIEKLADFNRERIPERVVHAKGAGAHGYFEVYQPMGKYTKAKFLQHTKKKTPVFVRFSTVIGSKGSADTARDPRGFAVKFYTEEGNYDLVGNNIPVFFIRDAMKFPDLVHAFKPAPDTNIQSSSRIWDFLSNTPEATHMITWLFSDSGTIKSYRTMEGFGVNTYIWVNDKGNRCYIKYHWKPVLGVSNITRQEAEILAGLDPDVATRDLYDTLNNGEVVEYILYVQMMDIKDEFNQDFDPLDATKVWPEDKFPLMKVGKMTLNKAPKNFFAEVEQSAFCTANIVPGVEISNDKLLQGRVFAYKDTQRYRLGINFTELPINRPKVKVTNFNQDGFMDYYANEGTVNYEPNTLNQGYPKEAPKSPSQPQYVEGDIVRKTIPLTNDFQQAGERYRSLKKEEQDHLIENIINDLWTVDKKIQLKAIWNLTQACREFGERVAKGLKIKY